MCGIAGAVGAIAPEVQRAVRRMSQAQVHRGPDDDGEFTSNEHGSGVAFAFRRLAIIDLTPQGHQPMVDPERGNVLVFNGELYNYRELRGELEQAGEVFRSSSDTEVVLRAYGCWGRAMLPRLRGMFAFAIYDPARRQTLLARDRLGIKALYHALISGPEGPVLLFASELRALLASELLERRLDPQGLASYVWNGFVVGPNTMLQGASLLPAGCSAVVPLEPPHVEPEPYWTLGPRPTRSAAEAVAELESALLSATRQHLMSDVPLGVFLSGGVDSSAVASLAVRAGSGTVKTFHIGFEEAGFDESRYARQVANALGTEHAEYRLTQRIFQDQLPDALASLDQPTFDAINTYFVSRVVREAGFTVALAGTGGDELFGGYPTFRELPSAWRVARAAQLVPENTLKRAIDLGLRAKYGRFGEVPPQTRWAKLGALLRSAGDPLAAYQVAYALFTPDFVEQLAGQHGSGVGTYGLSDGRAKELRLASRGVSGPGRVSTFELALFVGERLLRDSDAASMAVSLELRVPLLDHQVVEAAQSVPDAVRFRPFGKKRLLKSLALLGVDSKVFERPKAGFVLPIEVWAKDRLASEIEAVFSNRQLVESVGLRPEPLQRLWRAFRNGAPGMYWSRVWSPFVLLHWCRTHNVGIV